MRVLALLLILVALGCSRSFSPPQVGGAPLGVEPSSAQVAPLGTVTLQIRGGQPGYVLTGEPSHAGRASISGSQVAYVAGAVGSVDDAFFVGDSAGARVAVRIHIGPGLSLTPPSATVPVHESQLFLAQGGQAPYRYAVDPALADGGATMDGGLFLAGPSPRGGVVTVTDANAAQASAQVVVTAGVTIIPQGARVAPGGTLQLVAVGGRPPYQWSAVGLTTTKGSRIDPATGALSLSVLQAAGAVTVQATDSAGGTGSASVLVLPALQAPPIPPPTVIVPGYEFDLVASGGSPPYQYRYADRGNVSGGAVSPSGHYRAGPNGNQTDSVVIQDTTGTSVTVAIDVGTPALTSAALATAFSRAIGTSQITPWMKDGELLARSVDASGFGAGLVRDAPNGQLLPSPMPPGTPLAYADLNGDGHVDLVVDDPLAPGQALVYVGSAQGSFTLVGGGGAVPPVLAVLPAFRFGSNVITSQPVVGATLVGPAGSPSLDLQAGTVEDLLSGRGLVSLGLDAGPASQVIGAVPLTATPIAIDSAVIVRVDTPSGAATNVIDISYHSVGIISPSVAMNAPALVATVDGFPYGARPFVAAPLRGRDDQRDLVLMTQVGDVSAIGYQLTAVLGDPSGAASLVTTPLPGTFGSSDAPRQVLVGPARSGLGSVVVTNDQGELAEYDLVPASDGGWAWSVAQPLADALPPASRADVAATGDLDGDGNLDLAIADSAGGLTLYFGNAGGGFEGVTPVGLRGGTRFRGGSVRVPFQYVAVPLDGGSGLLVDDDGALALFGGSANASTGQPTLGLLAQTPPVGFAKLIGTFTEQASGRTFILGFDGVSRLLAAELIDQQIRSPALVADLFPGALGATPVRFALIDPVHGGRGSTLAVVRELVGDGGLSATVDLVPLTAGTGPLTAGAPSTVLSWVGAKPISSFAAVDLDGVPPADLVFTYPAPQTSTAGPQPWAYYALATADGGGLLGPAVPFFTPASQPTDARVLVDAAGTSLVIVDGQLSANGSAYHATRYSTGAAFDATSGVTVELAQSADGGAGCLVEPELLDTANGGLALVAALLHPRTGLCNSGPRVANNLPEPIDGLFGSIAAWSLGAPANATITPSETALAGAHTAPNLVLLDVNGDGVLDVAAQLVSPATTKVLLDLDALQSSSAALDLNLWAGLPDGGFAP